MASTTVTLDEQHFRAASEKALELGTTPEVFIHSLIDAATMTFDQILFTVRESFVNGDTSEGELDDAIADARKAILLRSLQDDTK